MKKEEIRYFVAENQTSGYAFMSEPKQLSENSILNFLCEWSKGKGDVKIYSHALRKTEEGGNGKYHYASEYGMTEEENAKAYKELGGPELGGMTDYNKGRLIYKIPCVDWVYYLDIWYQ